MQNCNFICIKRTSNCVVLRGQPLVPFFVPVKADDANNVNIKLKVLCIVIEKEKKINKEAIS